MEISGMMAQQLQSVQAAVSTAMLSKVMNAQSGAVAQLLQGMQQTVARDVRLSVEPHIGVNLDIEA